MYYCYILRNNSEEYKNYTYNGYTVNPWRRVRQHNGIIKGGAKATAKKNNAWEVYVLITGFVTSNNALSCEWRIKKPLNKKRIKEFTGPVGRVKSLNYILDLDVWTQQCDINNNNCNYTVYIVDDMRDLLTIEKPNITIISVPAITEEFVKL
jgi:predicted GIY-YIG superfamily endonuclease